MVVLIDASPAAGVRRIGLVGMSPIAAFGLTALLRGDSRAAVVHIAQHVDDLGLDRTRMDVVLLDAEGASAALLDAAVTRCNAAGVSVVVFARTLDRSVLDYAHRFGAACVSWASGTSELVAALLQDGSPSAVTDSGGPRLTPTERAVLMRYSEGWTAGAVADDLGLAVHSVNTYVQRIRRKYEQAGRPATSRVDLFRRAVEDGVVPRPYA